MIDSPSNPVVKSLKALSEGKTRRTSKQFVVEGVRAVEDGLSAGFKPVTCLFNAELLSRTVRGATLLRRLQRSSLPSIYEASERALGGATETIHPQGIVAAFPFLDWDRPISAKGAPLFLICDDIRDPGNLGTLLRTAEAAGVHAMWTTPGTVDIYNPKVVRAAMGTHFRLPIFPERTWDAIERELNDAGVSNDRLFCSDIQADLAYDAVDWKLPGALIVSNEAHGLTTQARQACERGASICIPMAAGTESLNAAIAGAVILFEAARQRRQVANDA
jgi:TrmH family RNA methyltransferase